MQTSTPLSTTPPGAPVLVLGLGASGLAMARWCGRSGAAVRVWDSREHPPGAAALRELLPAATLVSGPLTDAAFDGIQVVCKSPGLSPRDERIRAPLERAVAGGAVVQGELDLFARALADLRAERGYAPKVVAITGTNGKTTTTAMAAQLIARTGRRVAVAGNIGPTLLQTLADALDHAADTADLPEVWVLELSSFQLDRVHGFEPDAAAVLNLTEDHLDWHGSLAEYIDAKRRVFGERTLRVVNRDDPHGAEWLPTGVAGGKRSARKPVAEPSPVVRFGLDAPGRPGDFGLVEDNGLAWLVRAGEPEDTGSRGRGARRLDDADAEPRRLQRLMPADALRVRGRHNAANALAALALCTAIGCPLAPMLHGLREYAGEPHRLQFIASVDRIDAYDDSKGTNVGATVAALDGLGADRSPAKIVVILGGDGKGQDFAPLAAPVQRHVRGVALIGRDAARIEAALKGVGVPMQRHATLEAAVAWGFDCAAPGDALLLSPACASLDMFRDYEHRAQVFVAEVLARVAERGGVAA